MLFDLQGPRKTFVKAIYLGLAILMAGGLVLFGIGSDVNGGLADVFGGSPAGDLRKTVEKSEEAVAKDPMTKKVHDSYMAFKTKFDRWSEVSDEAYLVKVRG